MFGHSAVDSHAGCMSMCIATVSNINFSVGLTPLYNTYRGIRSSTGLVTRDSLIQIPLTSCFSCRSSCCLGAWVRCRVLCWTEHKAAKHIEHMLSRLKSTTCATNCADPSFLWSAVAHPLIPMCVWCLCCNAPTLHECDCCFLSPHVREHL